ncbi:DUF433 domain-containing protein [candidate division KSB1 bacterium]|nr:DUF433 domain-containing protein [candidate division KSB1 bacterium]
MEKQYVEKRDKGCFITGTRISLDSVVLAFLDGLSPETIASEGFPVLTLKQIYGAITFYQNHQDKIDDYLKQAEAEFTVLRQKTNEPSFTQKITNMD